MPVYSHSKFSTYETCPWQYKFRYIDQIRPLREKKVFPRRKIK